MNRAELVPLLAEARTVAGRAGTAILEVYSQDFAVEIKEDRSPLTRADRTADAIIREGLAQLTVRYPVLSEESATPAASLRAEWERYWLVDPLDGTKEFIKRNGEFTVNIALIDRHEPVLGVVLAPALALEYSGLNGYGAWKRSGAGPLQPIRASADSRPPLRIVGSRSHPSPELATYLERLGSHQLVPMGSSLKICLVAEGSADLYPRFGPTREWDTAAAQAVLESAGGVMMDTLGQPLRYNTRDDLLNPRFLAFGDRKRDWLAPMQTKK
jgi:3'(2'), 5'-bisphosphate nucleotidase